MKKNIIGIFLFLATFSNLFAQTDTSFTLQQCIDYALENQINVINAEIDEAITKARVNQTKARGYPQVNGSVGLVDNPALSPMFLSTNNPFASGGSGTAPDGSKKSGDIIVTPNLFQLRSSGDANITASQLIFDASYFVGLKAAPVIKELSRKATTQTKIQTVENVTKGYYLVIISQERAKLFDINLKRVDSLLNQSRILNENGFIEKIDVDRIEVQYNNLLTDKQNFDNILSHSWLLLKFQMGMPLDQAISLSEQIGTIQLDLNSVPSDSLDYSKIIEYSILKSNESIERLRVKDFRSQRLPKLSAFATGGYIRQDTKFGNLFGNEWFPYSRVGINLSVPILGLQSQYQVQEAKLGLKKVRNNLTYLESALEIQAKQANLSYKNSLQAMAAQKRNMELAMEVARVSKLKYAAGIGSNLEVTNAESDLKQAQINYYNALYDAIVSKVDVQKSTGTLFNE